MLIFNKVKNFLVITDIAVNNLLLDFLGLNIIIYGKLGFRFPCFSNFCLIHIAFPISTPSNFIIISSTLRV